MKRLTLLFSGKRGGGITDLTNIVNGFIKNQNSEIKLKVITLRKFSHLEQLCSNNNISYISISNNCDTIFKEIFANVIYIFTMFRNISTSKTLLFTMTHPNLLVFPIYRFISLFTNCKLYYIRHNPIGFRHVENKIKNSVVVLSDYIASKFSHRLLFFSKNVLKSFDDTTYKHKSYYIGFGINTFDSSSSQVNISDNKTFIFFGRCLPYKGLDILIEALKLIDTQRLNFIIASSSIPKNYLQELSKLQHNHNLIIFNEWLEDDALNGLFQKCFCAVLPYKEISQSGPILTSIGYKIPIITSNLPGVREYLTDNSDSLLFISEDPASLKEKILLFVKSTDIQNTLSKGIMITANKFSWKNVSINIENIITND